MEPGGGRPCQRHDTKGVMGSGGRGGGWRLGAQEPTPPGQMARPLTEEGSESLRVTCLGLEGPDHSAALPRVGPAQPGKLTPRVPPHDCQPSACLGFSKLGRAPLLMQAQGQTECTLSHEEENIIPVFPER